MLRLGRDWLVRGAFDVPSDTRSASHWRSLAREARAAAGAMRDPAAKQIMLNIAKGYEHLASIAEAREKKSK